MRNESNQKPPCSCPKCDCNSQDDFVEPKNFSRRTVMSWIMTAVPVLALLLPTKDVLAESGGAKDQDVKKLPPQPGDLLTYFSKRKRGKVLTLDDLEVDKKQVLALPMAPDGTVRDGSRFNQILLQRLDMSTLDEETAAMAADGVIAYSAICTHSGCAVVGWAKDDHHYVCPCHHTIYDPKKSAVVVDGPAPRALPALPVKLDDGKIVVAGKFTSWIGFKRPGI